MRDRTPLSDDPHDGRFGWDLGTFLLVAAVLLLVFWITAELWLPHWGPH